MKKPKAAYEYRFKFKIEGRRVIQVWGITYAAAFMASATTLKGEGYKEKGRYKIGCGRYIIRFVKSHRFGAKTLVVFVTQLPGKRRLCIDRSTVKE
jgi:hypothetical protein